MKELFNYIQDQLKHTTNGKSVDIHKWGDAHRASHFDAAKRLWEQVKNDNIIEVDGQTYLLEHHSAENGMGGMDQGSPETIRFKKINPTPIKINDIVPEPVENPDWAGVISLAKKTIENVNNNGYLGKDMEHYAYEEVMKAVYGNNIFDWINKNTD